MPNEKHYWPGLLFCSCHNLLLHSTLLRSLPFFSAILYLDLLVQRLQLINLPSLILLLCLFMYRRDISILCWSSSRTIFPIIFWIVSCNIPLAACSSSNSTFFIHRMFRKCAKEFTSGIGTCCPSHLDMDYVLDSIDALIFFGHSAYAPRYLFTFILTHLVALSHYIYWCVLHLCYKMRRQGFT